VQLPSLSLTISDRYRSMGNEKKNTSKAAAKAAKKQKAEAKTSKKEKKKSKKTTDAPPEDEDLEAILDKVIFIVCVGDLADPTVPASR